MLDNNKSGRTFERDEFIVYVNEAIEKIQDIKKELEAKNQEIPSLIEIKKQFANIYDVLGKKQNEINNGIKDLNLLLDEIKRSQMKILNNKTDIIYETIKANLPKDMKLDPLNGDVKNCILLYDDKNIGTIEIIQEDDSLKAVLKINDYEYEKFPVTDELAMYEIINQINIKFYYDKSSTK